ncbi:hypothetical protein J7438_11965 [Thalassotalea sp. G20_0]|uniref:hypothetical protein n=1 Tax=Thalassotalea sp. G20_0 TaxID=2821093 RepID=UPI001ADB8671|nr:hypothetical protein [Thalassotalea sp. G20_0]MBO9494793.1 hypothetical protein [Thalassotalea sp. G20_0]
MISPNYSQQTMVAPLTSEELASTATVDIKFGNTFRAVREVFAQNILQDANKTIDKDSRYFVDQSSCNLSWLHRVSPEGSLGYFGSQYVVNLIPVPGKVNVKFDQHCQIIDRENFVHQLVTSNEALIELAIKGVEFLARQFSSEKQSMEVLHLGIGRHYISNKGLKGGLWHRHKGNYSLVMLMNDDSVIKNNAPYYTGGRLETAKFAGQSLGKGILAVEGTTEKHVLEPNSGYVFSNIEGNMVLRHADGEYVSVNPEQPQEKPQEKPLEKRILIIIMNRSSKPALQSKGTA